MLIRFDVDTFRRQDSLALRRFGVIQQFSRLGSLFCCDFSYMHVMFSLLLYWLISYRVDFFVGTFKGGKYGKLEFCAENGFETGMCHVAVDV